MQLPLLKAWRAFALGLAGALYMNPAFAWSTPGAWHMAEAVLAAMAEVATS